MNKNPREQGAVLYKNPYLCIFFIAGTIFFAEGMVMFVLMFWEPQSALLEILFDSTTLVLITVPVIYFFMLRPLVGEIDKRKDLEKALAKAQEQQIRVDQVAKPSVC